MTIINAAYWLFAIEAALIPRMAIYTNGDPIVSYFKEPLSSIMFEAEAGCEFKKVQLFITGSMRSMQLYRDGTTFSPILQRYDIGAGVRFGNVEIGVRHFCEHPVLTYSDVIRAPVDMARREIYARIEFGGNR